MPSSTLSTTNAAHLASNQSLLHVKFHANRFQDNLLNKRLQKLNGEEMKQRLKHQRMSNELVLFLRECQKSTGYLAQMRPTYQLADLSSSADSRLFMSSNSNTNNFDSYLRLSVNDLTKNAYNFLHTNQIYLSMRGKVSASSSSKKSDSSLNFTDLSLCDSNSSNASVKNSTRCNSSSSSAFSSNSSDCTAESSAHTKKLSSNAKNSIPRTKPASFFPSAAAARTRLTLSNLDWRNENMPENNSSEFVKPCKTVRADARFKSKSLNFSAAKSCSSSILLNRKESLECFDNNNNNNNNNNNANKEKNNKSLKKKLSFQLDEEESKNQADKTMNRIKINISRSFIRRKQSEIVDEYKRFSNTEILNNLRQIQLDLEQKVKQFAFVEEEKNHHTEFMKEKSEYF